MIDRARRLRYGGARGRPRRRTGCPSSPSMPEPSGPGELVRVSACGLCGSDVEKLGRAPAGTVLGHEVAGVLESGARVTVMHRVPCGACERCRAGHESTCGAVSRAAARSPADSRSACVRPTACRCPTRCGEHDGVWVEPLACVLRAAERFRAGGRVLVVGCGAIGRLWIQVLTPARPRGAGRRPASRPPGRSSELGAEVDVGPSRRPW